MTLAVDSTTNAWKLTQPPHIAKYMSCVGVLTTWMPGHTICPPHLYKVGRGKQHFSATEEENCKEIIVSIHLKERRFG
jgi:hypothetical protein